MSRNRVKISDSPDQAALILQQGGLVAFPTETVYGLGADAQNELAIKRIYLVKARPTHHPIIVHVSSISMLSYWTKDIPNFAFKIAETFWPGPLTLILKKTKNVSNFITGHQDTVGIRIPSDPIATKLLNAFEKLGGHGVAAPSANRFGRVSPTSTSAVILELGEYLSASDLILRGNQCSIGIESTIIDCTKTIPSILRPGQISAEMVESTLKTKVLNFDPNSSNVRVKFSGSFDSHYAPKARVFIERTPNPGDGFIAYTDLPTPKGVMRLASPKNNSEYARMLYYALRLADIRGLKNVVAMPALGSGIAEAINDRLRRASNANSPNI